LDSATIRHLFAKWLVAPPVQFAAELDWYALVHHAQHERITPQLLQMLSQAQALPQLPVPLRLALQTNAYQRTAHAALLHDFSDKLQARLTCPAIFLKSSALAGALYPTRAQRVLNDLDVLVAERDVPKLVALLQELGLTRQEWAHEPLPDYVHIAAYHRIYQGGVQNKVEVELHWSLIAHPRDPVAPDVAWFWQNTLPFGTHPLAFQLNPTANALYLPAHIVLGAMADSDFSGCLLWFYDLFLFLGKYRDAIDWQGVIEQAKQWGWSQVLAEGYQGLLGYFPATPLPASFISQLTANIATRDRQVFADREHNRSQSFGRVWAHATWQERFRILQAYTLPSTEFLRWRYPQLVGEKRITLLAHRWKQYLLALKSR